MQQRRPRLGDILDDYCPRERRITNHAVVAMIDDHVKQTRCTTCDADHEYKEARVPSSRRKKPGGALLAETADSGIRPRAAVNATTSSLDDDGPESELPLDDSKQPIVESDEPHLAAADSDESHPAAMDDEQSPEIEPADDEGPVHRPLIRATLPRPEGQVPERKAPDFTLRQNSGRGFDGNRNGHRQRGSRPPRQAQGSAGGQSARFGGPRQGAGPGSAHGHGQRQTNRPGGGGQRGRRPPSGGQGGGQGRKRGR